MFIAQYSMFSGFRVTDLGIALRSLQLGDKKEDAKV